MEKITGNRDNSKTIIYCESFFNKKNPMDNSNCKQDTTRITDCDYKGTKTYTLGKTRKNGNLILRDWVQLVELWFFFSLIKFLLM